jgi:glycosyltransferase involved in cell wall biosynthesis
MLLMTLNEGQAIDVIVRTKNSQEFLKECLEAILAEIPIRRVIIVDAGSTDLTKKIASSYDKVEFYSCPEMNLGQATKYGLSMAQTEWVAIIDSDVVLRKGWFGNIKKYMQEADAVEGCRIDHYSFSIKRETIPEIGWLGHTLIKKGPILQMDLDTQFGEDTVVKFNFDKKGKIWKKTPNSIADHYTKIDNMKHIRTGMIFRPEPQVISVPKDTQIQQGHIVRKCKALTKKQAIKILLLVPIYEAYWAFKKNFWFTLAYFKLL